MPVEGCYMGVRQQVVFEVIEAFRRGEYSRAQVADLLKISLRTVSRKAKQIAKLGMLGTQHQNKGKAPHNRLPDEITNEVIQLMKERYYDFNLLHAHEQLTQKHGIKICYKSLVNICSRNKLRPEKKRRASKSRMARERYANEGLLLQMDGSHHKWNGVDEWCLISIIDDATSKLVYVRFEEGETTWACLRALRAIVQQYGVPYFIYADKAGWANQSSPKRNHFSQFVRACKELGIEVIAANSPEAKGRIERSNRTLQGRLVPEFRLHEVHTLKHANQYLEQVTRPQWNERFIVTPQSPHSRFRPFLNDLPLDEITCYKYDRTVAKDNCVYFNNQNYQILPGPYGDLRRKPVRVHEYENGAISFYYGSQRLEFRIQPKRVRTRLFA